MKLQKLVDQDKGIDTYVIRINHVEATEAFKAMTAEERMQIHDLQREDKISAILKTLTMWTEKIEETKRALGRPRRSDRLYEG